MLDHLRIQDSVCAEIGVFKGKFSVHILKHNPKMLYLIDPWVGCGFPRDHGKSEEIYRKIVSRLSRPNTTIIRSTSYDAYCKLKDNKTKLDFVYIDGLHDYEHCKQDIECWYSLLRSGGWLCGDDYLIPGVHQAVKEFLVKLGRKPEAVSLDIKSGWGRGTNWGIMKA